MKTIAVSTVLALMLVGCASTQAPLIYVSKQTLGVEIVGGTQDVGSASFVLGFRNTDVAIVPTIASNKDGSKVGRIGGCYNAGHNVGKIDSCYQDKDVISGEANQNQKETRKAGATNNLQMANSSPIINFNDKVIDPNDTITVPSKALEPTNTGNGGNQSQSVRDSLSVYGTFDSGTKASGDTAAVTLGKVFATGVAAQHLTEGISLRERRLALSTQLEKRTACIKAVKDALGDKTTSSDLSRCDEKSAAEEK